MKISKSGFCKRLAIVLLVMSTLLITIVPAYAEPTQQPIPDISNWARGTLNEGERLGTYPLTWYYDGFRESITEEKLQHLVEKTADKFADLNLEVNEDFTSIDVAGTTREAVLISLYNCLAKYKLPEQFEIESLKPLDYLLNRGIIKGSSKGLELERDCKTEEAVIMATRLIFDTYDSLNAGAKGFLWKVQKNENTVYMLGSVHLGSSDVYPMNKVIRDSYSRADTLVVEANILNQQALMGDFIQRAMYSDGTTLQDHISEELYNKCVDAFNKLGLPVEVMNRFKPWSIANDLSALASTNSSDTQEVAQAANAGIDMYFLSKALLDEKPVDELEGIIFQADLFNGLSAETQENYLSQAVESFLNPSDDGNTSADLLNAWLLQWKNGSIDEFKEDYIKTLSEDNTEISKMLFGKRDESMTEKISAMLDNEGSKTYFVVVGAGHLTVNNSVVDRLTDLGYEVEVVK